jgi:hypothetical protein
MTGLTVMAFAGGNDNGVVFNLVNKPVFLGYPPGKVALQIAFERLRFADAFGGVPFNVSDKFCDFPGDSFVFVCPFKEAVERGNIVEGNFHCIRASSSAMVIVL